MGRRKKNPEFPSVKINLTIHPEIREWAKVLARRRTLSQLFEDLVEAEWSLRQAPTTRLTLPPAPPIERQSQYLPHQRYQLSPQHQQQ